MASQRKMSSDQRTELATTMGDRLLPIMEAGIDHGVFPGGVVLVRLANTIVFHQAYGHSSSHQDQHTRLTEPRPTTLDTVYDLASLTKLFTATCVMQLVDDRKIELDDAASRYLPAFAVNGKAEITIRQLLTHATGLPNFRLWLDAPDLAARMQLVMAATPGFPPGSAVLYHDTNFIVLGNLIEAIEGRRLDDVMQRRLLDPLGLRHTQFGPITGGDVAATEDESYVDRGMVRGEVHDENAWALNHVAGHAGLFSTAGDVSVFGQMYLDGGSFADSRVLAATTVREMTRNQVPGLGFRGLGWQLNAPSYMGNLASPDTFGHTGFTGTSIVVDPGRELVVVLMTNRVHPTRHGPSINDVRQAVADAVLASLDDTVGTSG